MSRSTAEMVRSMDPFRVSTTSMASRPTAITSGLLPSTLNALDPASGKILRSIDVAACGDGLRRRAPVSTRRGSHPEDRSEDRPCARRDPGATVAGLRAGMKGRSGWATIEAEDPSSRSANREGSSRPVESFCDRRHVGRRRALARHLGR